jgi:HEAT repeat protein
VVFVVFSLVCRGYAQVDKPPDYTRKSVAEWIEILIKSDKGARWGPADEAQDALGPSGPYAKTAIPALIEAFDTEDDNGFQIADTLADYGTTAVPHLIRAMKSPKANVRRGAANALMLIRPLATNAVPVLLEAIKDQDPKVRTGATGALSTIGVPDDKANLAVIAELLKDERVEVRRAMLYCFTEPPARGGRPAPKSATPLLIKALSDKDEEVLYGSLVALAVMGPEAKEAVPSLIEALRSKQMLEHQNEIMGALSCIGPDAKAAVPAMLQILKADDDKLKDRAIGVLGSIGDASTVPEILRAAKGKDKSDRLSALGALGRFRPVPKDVVPTLIEALKGEDKEARKTAMQSLGEIGAAAKDAVPALVEILKSYKPFTRQTDAYYVVEALQGIGADAKAAVPTLMELARDGKPDEWTRRQAARAVMHIDPETAAKEDMEIAHLNIRLGKIPDIKTGPRPAVTEEKKKHIKGLIAKLSEIKGSNFGEEPRPDANGLGVLEQFRALVELGPDALPSLLDALDDKTPTRLTFRGGWLGFGSEIEGNLLNPTERRILSKSWVAHEDTHQDPFLRSYTLKVGDVCFVVIGQIVGRKYSYAGGSNLNIAFNSPLEVHELRNRVREIWKSDDPAKRLFDSLLLDYATGPSDFQTGAAWRLLYYFPKEAAPLIAARLQAMDVKAADGDDWKKREAKNGVQTYQFIRSVSWCKEPRIQEALAGISKRTDDPSLKEAITPSEK